MLPLTQVLARLVWAGFLGALLGIERNIHRRPAGMRTSFSVCLASALFTIASVEIAKRTGDTSTTRIASNIVQGIGFLGAGAIVRDRGGVTGLTTAAAIFASAAIGMSAGGGLFLISGVGCALVLFALAGLTYVEDWLGLKGRLMHFRVSQGRGDAIADAHRVFSELNVPLNAFRIAGEGAVRVVEFDAHVTHHQQQKIINALCREGGSCEMNPAEQKQE
jgi:putative Mg2+ transporter-C (MgtC) family protein